MNSVNTNMEERNTNRKMDTDIIDIQKENGVFHEASLFTESTEWLDENVITLCDVSIPHFCGSTELI